MFLRSRQGLFLQPPAEVLVHVPYWYGTGTRIQIAHVALYCTVRCSFISSIALLTVYHNLPSFYSPCTAFPFQMKTMVASAAALLYFLVLSSSGANSLSNVQPYHKFRARTTPTLRLSGGDGPPSLKVSSTGSCISNPLREMKTKRAMLLHIRYLLFLDNHVRTANRRLHLCMRGQW